MEKNEVFNVLRKKAAEIMYIDEESLTIEMSLTEIGANSIDRMDIIVDTMHELGLKLPMVSFGKAKNMSDITDILCTGLNEK